MVWVSPDILTQMLWKRPHFPKMQCFEKKKPLTLGEEKEEKERRKKE